MSRLFLLLISLLFTVFISAQPSSQYADNQKIKGNWEGVLIQKTDGLSGEYDFAMNIKFKKKKQARGTTRINIKEKENIYGEMKFKGFASNKILQFSEYQIIDANIDGGYWFLKVGYLIFTQKDGQDILYGEWDSILNKGERGEIVMFRKKG